VIHFQFFFGVSQRKEYHPGKEYERTGRMNALYIWERDSLERPHDAEAMERSALKQGKNFVRRDWTCEPKIEEGFNYTLQNQQHRSLFLHNLWCCNTYSNFWK